MFNTASLVLYKAELTLSSSCLITFIGFPLPPRFINKTQSTTPAIFSHIPSILSPPQPSHIITIPRYARPCLFTYATSSSHNVFSFSLYDNQFKALFIALSFAKRFSLNPGRITLAFCRSSQHSALTSIVVGFITCVIITCFCL